MNINLNEAFRVFLRLKSLFQTFYITKNLIKLYLLINEIFSINNCSIILINHFYFTNIFKDLSSLKQILYYYGILNREPKNKI